MSLCFAPPPNSVLILVQTYPRHSWFHGHTRNLNVDEAIKRLTATIRWRESYKAAETANESFPKEVFGGVGYVFGKDKENRPITYAAFISYQKSSS